jgi:dinuclear metal center YbgI/SA1388 family protein
MHRIHATVGDCAAVLDACFPPAWAASWDAVGLAVGDPAAPVHTVAFAVDPTVEVAREAVAAGASLLVTHHPLFLRGVHGVAETSAGGRAVATLVRAGAALFTAHTNADVARPGVSDALADAIGLREVVPLAPVGPAGPGSPGGPSPAAAGSPGAEAAPAPAGLGRVGELAEPARLRDVCAQVAAALPATAGGVRAAGDPDRIVRRVAVCGGSGGELAGAAAAAGAQAFVTADARHHHTLDALAAHDLAIVDVSHWASEQPWLAAAAQALRSGLAARGRTVNTSVSALVTDPWRWHAAAPGGGSRGQGGHTCTAADPVRSP